MTGTRRKDTRFDADKKTKRMSDLNRLKRKETRKERQRLKSVKRVSNVITRTGPVLKKTGDNSYKERRFGYLQRYQKRKIKRSPGVPFYFFLYLFFFTSPDQKMKG